MPLLDIFKRKKKSTPAKASAPGYIGIDIGSNCLHMCQLRPLSDGKYAIVAKVSIAFKMSRQELIQSPKLLKSLVQLAYRRKSFKGRKVVAFMPLEDVKIMLLTYKSKLADVDAEIIKMIGNRIEGNVDDYMVDYLTVRSNPSDEEHMSVVSVAHRDKVNAILNALTFCGLEVTALDIAPAALRRMVSTLYSGKSVENVLLINTDYNVSHLTIVSGRRLLFDQVVDFGENLLLESIAKSLDISPEEAKELVEEHGLEKTKPDPLKPGQNNETDKYASTLVEIVKPSFLKLVEEINRVMIFTSAETRGVPVSRVCLLGGVARWPGADKLLMSMLNFESPDDQIEFWHIFQDENDSTTISWLGLFPNLALATGLALRGIEDDERN